MTNARRKKIRQIALKVREWAESTWPWNSNTLEGQCGICSFALWRELQKQNIHASLADNGVHAFILIGDHILDITATQFGFRNRVILRQIERGPNGIWEVHRLATTLQSARKLFSDWPNDQNPFRGKICSKWIK